MAIRIIQRNNKGHFLKGHINFTNKKARWFKCITCGKKFKGKSCKVNKNCSAICRKIFQAKKNYICNYCGKEFRSVANNRADKRYCSNFCKGKMSISVFKKGLVPWNKNKPVEKIRGDKHYNWKGGISERHELNNVEWNLLKHQCYSRDNWTCFKCGKHIHKKGEIQAHHLIPKRLGGKDLLGYLITLCQSCHIKIEKSIWERLTRKENCSAVFN